MLLPLLLAIPVVRAAEPPLADAPVQFALVVGSNRAGPGQRPLQFAHADAARVAGVLEEVGGVAPGDLEVLTDPDADELFAAIDAFAQDIADAPGPTRFAFYYSGHARAGALDLGEESVPLEALRERLETVGATLTVVVLDACQSGLVSDVKGVAATADFSTASVGSLASEGIAIIASSTDTELSQESTSVGGSFFTVNLVTGLRGPADADADGDVTLAEAYAYAYHRTIADTAATAVGAQHPTLETDLRGRGDLVLSSPAAASAKLSFPADLVADLVIIRNQPEVIAAEVHKAAGETFALALRPGEYRAIVRRAEGAVSCRFTVSEGTATALDVSRCPAFTLEPVAAKGEIERPKAHASLFAEVGGGLLATRNDGFTERIADFGFDPGDEAPIVGTWSLGVAWSPLRNLALVAGAGSLEQRTASRTLGSHEDQFAWNSHRLDLAVRGQLPLLHGHLSPYAQVGGGLAWSASHFRADGDSERELHAGPELALAVGLQEAIGHHFGLLQQLGWATAPALPDLIGDVHDNGGISAILGLRAGY
jgi:hypothetical protein